MKSIKNPLLLIMICLIIFSPKSYSGFTMPWKFYGKQLVPTAMPCMSGTGVVSITGGSGCFKGNPPEGQGPYNWEVVEGESYTMTISGVTECSGDVITVFVQSSNTGNFCFNATGGNGTYVGEFTMPNPACFTLPLSYKCGANQSCDNPGSFDARGPDGASKVHLRTSNFDGDCVWQGQDEDCTRKLIPPQISCTTTNEDLACDPASIPDPDPLKVEITEGNCGGSVVLSSTISDVSVGCKHSRTITYTVTDTCKQTASCQSVYTWATSNPVLIVAEGNTSVCDDDCVTLKATDGFIEYLWFLNDVFIPDQSGQSLEACVSGKYSVYAINDCECRSYSNVIEVTIIPTPICALNVPSTLPVCGLEGRTLSALITGDYTTVNWTLSSSDNSWIITGGQGTGTIVYTAGNKGIEATFTIEVCKVVNNVSCCCTSSISFGSLCQENCTYTQGFYGNTGKICDGSKTALEAINSALSSGPMVMGLGNRTITIGTAEGSCVNSKLPSGATAAVLPVGNKTCATATGTAYLKNGKFLNILLGQAITLNLNIRLDAALGSLQITNLYLTSYKASSCENGIAVNGTKLVKSIPQAVLDCLGSNNTVSDLLTLANQGLGNALPCTVTLPNIVEALTSINESFDKCRIFGGFGSDPLGARSNNMSGVSNNSSNGKLHFSLYPNPVNHLTILSFNAPISEIATVELFKLNGERINNLFTGFVTENNYYEIQMNSESIQNGFYLVKLSIGDHYGYSKMIVIK